MFPALAGGFLTEGPPWKFLIASSKSIYFAFSHICVVCVCAHIHTYMHFSLIMSQKSNQAFERMGKGRQVRKVMLGFGSAFVVRE